MGMLLTDIPSSVPSDSHSSIPTSQHLIPSVSTSFPSPNIECKDDDGKTSIFSFDGKKKRKRSCSWIKKQVDINEFCEIQSVKSFCKQTCNNCTASLLSLLPSSQPSVDSS